MHISSSPALLLAQRHLFVVSDGADLGAAHDAGHGAALTALAARLPHHARVDGRAALEALLGALLAARAPAEATPRTLDLIGPTTASGLLRLGGWELDAARPSVAAFFRGLADADVPRRLGLHAMRLVGAGTARGAPARRTLRRLAALLGVEVYGAPGLVELDHATPAALAAAARRALIASSDARDDDGDDDGDGGDHDRAAPALAGRPAGRALDVDGLVAVAPAAAARALDRDTAARVLALVDRHAGVRAPVLATPGCTLALPAAAPGRVHELEVLLDGAYVRVRPLGDEPLVYPVRAPAALRALLAAP